MIRIFEFSHIWEQKFALRKNHLNSSLIYATGTLSFCTRKFPTASTYSIKQWFTRRNVSERWSRPLLRAEIAAFFSHMTRLCYSNFTGTISAKFKSPPCNSDLLLAGYSESRTLFKEFLARTAPIYATISCRFLNFNKELNNAGGRNLEMTADDLEHFDISMVNHFLRLYISISECRNFKMRGSLFPNNHCCCNAVSAYQYDILG